MKKYISHNPQFIVAGFVRFEIIGALDHHHENSDDGGHKSNYKIREAIYICTIRKAIVTPHRPNYPSISGYIIIVHCH